MDSIRITIESPPRLTLTAEHTAEDTDGIRQTLALIQTYLRSLLGEREAEPAAEAAAKPARRPARKPAAADDGGAK